MFQGRTYRRFGLNDLCIGFTDRAREDDRTCKDGGIVTLTYASEFSQMQKAAMACRILAAMNLTAPYTLEHLERVAPVTPDESEQGEFDSRPFRRMPGPANLVIGFDGRCPAQGIFGKNAGFAMVSYADEIDKAEREPMVRRIVAALNYTRNLSLTSLEQRCDMLQLKVELERI